MTLFRAASSRGALALWTLMALGCSARPEIAGSEERSETAAATAPDAAAATALETIARIERARDPARASRPLVGVGTVRRLDPEGPVQIARGHVPLLIPILDHALPARRSAAVSLPSRADGAFRLADERSDARIEVTLRGARAVAPVLAQGLVVYPGAMADGAHVIHRPTLQGTEDLVLYERAPEDAELVYDVALGGGIEGLRLVDDVLELVDGGGAPRLRVNRPFLVGADGARHRATLALDGCAADTSPAAPWGRPPTSPGSRTCALRVDWRAALGVAYPAIMDPVWTATDAMIDYRDRFPAVRLANGQVLVEGGNSFFTSIGSAELYDPVTGTWGVTGSLPGRYDHTASLLPNGKVLVVGGVDYDLPEVYLAGASVYDPALGTFAPTASLTTARTGHCAGVLADGTVLVVGGYNQGAGELASAERYDPQTGGWSPSPAMIEARARATATVLLDGRVLLVGGSGTNFYLNTAEIFNPVTGTWTSAGMIPDAKADHVAARLPNGHVLVAGGYWQTHTVGSADVFDPATGFWNPVDPLPDPRDSFTATVLSDGKVLVAGGDCVGFECAVPDVVFKSALFFDPASLSWQSAGDMVSYRYLHAAQALDGESVLVMGGWDNNLAEVFSYYEGGHFCASDIECLSGHCVESLCCDAACDGLCMACTALEKGTGTDGVCGAVAAGTDPGDECPDDGSPSCERNGLCDGGGACQKYASQPCTPQPCGAPEECASGHCVDGICCNVACDGACETCAKTKGSSEDGLCQPVASGSDPDDDCLPGPGPAACAEVELCDGNGACASAEELCAPYLCADASSCGKGCVADDECVQGFRCSDDHTCVPRTAGCDGPVAHTEDGTETDCTPYLCSPDGSCRSKCSSIDDCVPPAVCNTSSQCVSAFAAKAEPSDDGGCGCRAPGRRSPHRGLGALVVVALIAFRVRLLRGGASGARSERARARPRRSREAALRRLREGALRRSM